MSQISRRNIENGAIDSTKLEKNDRYTVVGLTAGYTGHPGQLAVKDNLGFTNFSVDSTGNVRAKSITSEGDETNFGNIIIAQGSPDSTWLLEAGINIPGDFQIRQAGNLTRSLYFDGDAGRIDVKGDFSVDGTSVFGLDTNLGTAIQADNSSNINSTIRASNYGEGGVSITAFSSAVDGTALEATSLTCAAKFNGAVLINGGSLNVTSEVTVGGGITVEGDSVFGLDTNSGTAITADNSSNINSTIRASNSEIGGTVAELAGVVNIIGTTSLEALTIRDSGSNHFSVTPNADNYAVRTQGPMSIETYGGLYDMTVAPTGQLQVTASNTNFYGDISINGDASISGQLEVFDTYVSNQLQSPYILVTNPSDAEIALQVDGLLGSINITPYSDHNAVRSMSPMSIETYGGLYDMTVAPTGQLQVTASNTNFYGDISINGDASISGQLEVFDAYVSSQIQSPYILVTNPSDAEIALQVDGLLGSINITPYSDHNAVRSMSPMSLDTFGGLYDMTVAPTGQLQVTASNTNFYGDVNIAGDTTVDGNLIIGTGDVSCSGTIYCNELVSAQDQEGTFDLSFSNSYFNSDQTVLASWVRNTPVTGASYVHLSVPELKARYNSPSGDLGLLKFLFLSNALLPNEIRPDSTVIMPIVVYNDSSAHSGFIELLLTGAIEFGVDLINGTKIQKSLFFTDPDPITNVKGFPAFTVTYPVV